MARPDVPDVGTPEYEVWKTTLTIPYEGGYIEATYGDLVQTFNVENVGSACTFETKAIAVGGHSRTNKIGGTPKTIQPYNYTYLKFPRKNSSMAAGGAVYTFHTDIGTYEARVGGDVQDFAKFMCSKEDDVYGVLQVQSGSGAWYGPYSATT